MAGPGWLQDPPAPKLWVKQFLRFAKRVEGHSPRPPLTCALSWQRSYCFLGWGTWLCRCCSSSCADVIFSVSRLAQI